MNRMDTAEDLQQIARFNSEIMTQEEMKQIYSQKYDEIKKLKEEIEKLKEENETLTDEILENEEKQKEAWAMGYEERVAEEEEEKQLKKEITS